MLQFTKFKKFYGSYSALNIGDVTLPPGIYWIRGTNGSGKTTLLKTISGLLAFDGDIFLEKSVSIKKNPVAYRKSVNYAEAEPLFPEFLTGMEMVNVFVQAKNAPPEQKDYFIESMKMQPYINRPLGTYSSGMLKKLSIVLAFIGNPKLISLDEPLITLDRVSLQILYQWISEANHKHGTSFLLASHQDMKTDTLISPKEILVEDQTLKFNS